MDQNATPPTTPTPISGGSAPALGTPPQGAPLSSAAAPPAGSSEPTKLPIPEGLDPAFWDETSGLKAADLTTHLNELRAFKASEDSKRAAVPDDPSKYELKLPADWKSPIEGMDFELSPDDPMVGLARDVAKDLGLDQSGFEKMVGQYAAREAAAAKAHADRVAATIAESKQKLGPKADERISAVEQWVAAVMGPGLLDQLKPGLQHHDLVVGIEKAMRHASSGGAPAFNQSGRTPAQTGVTDEDWSKLSDTQRLLTGMKLNQTRRVA